MANKFGSGIGGKGFTLVEVLVAMFIFTVITTAVVVNYRVGSRSTELRLAAEEVASFIRNAQIMSQAGRTVKLCAVGNNKGKVCEANASICVDGPECTAQVPLGGYGVYFKDTSASLKLFANSLNPDDRQFEEGEAVPGQELSLPLKISIKSIEPSAPLAVIFEPPRPRTWVNGASSGDAQIILQHVDTDMTRTITVKSISGRIEVNP